MKLTQFMLKTTSILVVICFIFYCVIRIKNNFCYVTILVNKKKKLSSKFLKAEDSTNYSIILPRKPFKKKRRNIIYTHCILGGFIKKLLKK